MQAMNFNVINRRKKEERGKRNKKLLLFFALLFVSALLVFYYNNSGYYQQRKVEVIEIYEQMEHPIGSGELRLNEASLLGAGTVTLVVVRKSDQDIENTIQFYLHSLLFDGWEIDRKENTERGEYISLIKEKKTISISGKHAGNEYIIHVLIRR